MKKRIVIKTGTYTDSQGQEKGEYTRLGVMMDGQNGPYLLIDPSVSLAGCIVKQNMMNHKAGKQVRDTLMVSVFEDQQQQNDPAQHASGNRAQQNPTHQQNSQQQQSNNFDDSLYYLPF